MGGGARSITSRTRDSRGRPPCDVPRSARAVHALARDCASRHASCAAFLSPEHNACGTGLLLRGCPDASGDDFLLSSAREHSPEDALADFTVLLPFDGSFTLGAKDLPNLSSILKEQAGEIGLLTLRSNYNLSGVSQRNLENPGGEHAIGKRHQAIVRWLDTGQGFFLYHDNLRSR